jgi:hypothetical protein
MGKIDKIMLGVVIGLAVVIYLISTAGPFAS